MIIAVNTRFLLRDYLEGYGYFLYESISRIVKNHPEHHFIFIFDRSFDPAFVMGPNITPVVIGPPARHPLLWSWWYDKRIPAVLKKHKADLFLSCDGFCSFSTTVPQCLVIHDLAFLHYPSFSKGSHVAFYKKKIPKFLDRANAVATVSEFSKKDILDHYPVDPAKLDVVYSAAKEIFRPLNQREKEETRSRYTNGKEYFVYAGAIHPRKNLSNLLKAFSIFKKRQGSGLKLVLAGRLAWKYKSFTDSLESYKYREDVIMTGYLDEQELVKIIGSAYAMVYPSLWEGFGVPVLEAMQCEVPVIASGNSPMQEIAGDAILSVDPNDYAAIAEKMMIIYKDETLRNQLIEKGKIASSLFSWERTSNLLWKTMMKALGDMND